MPCKKLLKIGFINAGSLSTNHDDFIAAMDGYDVDIMAINETWLRAGEVGRAPRVPGYRLRHIPRPQHICGGRGGGVGYYIRHGLNVRTRPHPADPQHNNVEQMWLSFTIHGKNIAIGTAYRPPWLNVELFLDALSDSVNFFSGCDSIIVLGDFNINLLDINDNKTKLFNITLQCLNLSQIVTSPTHFTANSQSLIDVVCTDLQPKLVTVDPVGTLGHSFIICEFNIKREKLIPYTISYRPLKDISHELFTTDLNRICWDSICLLSDVNEMVMLYNKYVINLFDMHAPFKMITIRDHSYPWITDNIRFMMRLRNEALSEYKRTNLDVKLNYYKDIKSLVNKSIFFEKVAYFKHNINNKIKEPKTLWNNLKSSVLNFSDDKELPAHFTDVNAINAHFLNVPGKSDVHLSQMTYFEFFHHNIGNIFSISTISPDSIYKILRNLKSNAEGCDNITLKMLFLTLPNSIQAITSLVNTSINTCTFPDIWKMAKVVPLPKKNNPVELKDLRPISILPCLSKIMEKVVCQQLTTYLEINKILPEVQSGFRRGRSTTTALLDVTDNILASQDQGKCTLLVLLDFSRAFDAINIPLLLSKLKYYGFDTAAIKWFNSYLSNRCQYVETKQMSGGPFKSSLSELKRGVPQGSILGPILFILYSADIIKCIHNSKCHIYADDMQVYIDFVPGELDRAIYKLYQDLARIVDWSEKNCLLLNPSKTKFMVLGSKHQLSQLPDDIDLELMGEKVERVYVIRNLGLKIDVHLRFEEHIADSVKHCFYRLKMLYKLRSYLSEELRTQLVETLILSKLNYADTVYGTRLLSRTQHLIQRVQNACARFCYNIPARSHVTPFLNKHYALKMKSRRKLHLASLLFGIINFKNPSYLYDKLNWIANTRSCSARNVSQQLSTQHHRRVCFRGSFRYAATKCWNNIPPPIRSLKSLHLFKYKLKQYLVVEQINFADINIDMSFI